MGRDISHLNFNLKHHDKWTFVLKLISFATNSHLFSLEVVQKCKHCQPCVLWQNSNEGLIKFFVRDTGSLLASGLFGIIHESLLILSINTINF